MSKISDKNLDKNLSKPHGRSYSDRDFFVFGLKSNLCFYLIVPKMFSVCDGDYVDDCGRIKTIQNYIEVSETFLD